MTYEQRATIFERARARGMTVARALEWVEKMVRESVFRARHRTANPIDPEAQRILAATAEHFGLTYEEVRAEGKLRAPESTYLARRTAALVMCCWGGLSHPAITAALARRNHTTSIALIQGAKGDPAALAAADAIAAKLGFAVERSAA